LDRYDFEQNAGIENWNGKLKKKNCNKQKIFQIFSLKWKNNRTEILKSKIATNREIFASFIIISELSKKVEILKRKIVTNRKIKQI